MSNIQAFADAVTSAAEQLNDEEMQARATVFDALTEEYNREFKGLPDDVFLNETAIEMTLHDVKVTLWRYKRRSSPTYPRYRLQIEEQAIYVWEDESTLRKTSRDALLTPDHVMRFMADLIMTI
jgi:hypothetical protein